jgi:hypothetical protein
MVRRIPEPELPPIQDLVDKLKIAHTKKTVLLKFKDGTEEHGAVTYVERLGTGRIIDIAREIARDYNVYEIEAVEVDADAV